MSSLGSAPPGECTCERSARTYVSQFCQAVLAPHVRVGVRRAGESRAASRRAGRGVLVAVSNRALITALISRAQFTPHLHKVTTLAAAARPSRLATAHYSEQRTSVICVYERTKKTGSRRLN